MSASEETSRASTAAGIVKDLRSHVHHIKELQKRSRPWDSDVEFQRQQIRRLQLQLLFKFPATKESKDVDNQLWMTTSHSFISTYKGLLANLDRERENNQHNGHPKGKPPRNVVEKRRLTQRFRQFLTAEDKFWRNFIVRYTTYFGLSDTKSMLLPVVGGEFDVTDDAMERSIFPDGQTEKSSLKQSDRDQQLAILSKALVCLGDLSRYREQQGDTPKGEAPNTSKGGRGGRHQSNGSARPPTYSKSQELYECARSLNPDIGNASHQLAIISNYQKDTFSAVYHYYRALCVRHPFETASENLQTVLSKALDVYFSKGDKSEEQVNASLTPKAQVESLKEKVVLLHASFRLNPEELTYHYPICSASTKLPNMTSTLILDFSSLVSDRNLTPDVMTRILTMGIGALWRVRMIRDTKKEREKEKEKEGKVSAEPRVASHLLQLMTALLRIGILQISDGSDAGDRDGSESNNLAMNITAVFRRVLPVLRICSKWTRAHLSYLISLFPPGGHGPKEVVTAIKDFWIAYQGFFTNLGKAFPSTDVPTLTGPLEEDVDMNGFVPLKKTMVAAFPKSSNGLALEQSRVHPNEEHLMRISDLLQDAREVAADEKSPIYFQDRKFSFKAPELAQPKSIVPPMEVKSRLNQQSPAIMVPPSVRSQALLQRSQQHGFAPVPIKEDIDDDGATVSTRTEDDPVHLAMHAVDRLSSDASDDMEEDEVLYPKQSVNTPMKSFATISPRIAAVQTPTLSPIGTRRGSNPQVMSPRHHRFSSPPQPIPDSGWTNAAQPPLLFGSGTGDAPSIWSTSHDPVIPSSNANPPFGQALFNPPLQNNSGLTLSGPALVSSSRSPPIHNAFAPKVAINDLDVPFKVDSPSNFVSHGALRGSLSMPPYGFIQPQPHMAAPYVAPPSFALRSLSQPLQTIRPDIPMQGARTDPYSISRDHYQDWPPPP